MNGSDDALIGALNAISDRLDALDQKVDQAIAAATAAKTYAAAARTAIRMLARDVQKHDAILGGAER